MATASKHPIVKSPANGSVRVEIFDQAYNLRVPTNTSANWRSMSIPRCAP